MERYLLTVINYSDIKDINNKKLIGYLPSKINIYRDMTIKDSRLSWIILL